MFHLSPASFSLIWSNFLSFCVMTAVINPHVFWTLSNPLRNCRQSIIFRMKVHPHQWLLMTISKWKSDPLSNFLSVLENTVQARTCIGGPHTPCLFPSFFGEPAILPGHSIKHLISGHNLNWLILYWKSLLNFNFYIDESLKDPFHDTGFFKLFLEDLP